MTNLTEKENQLLAALIRLGDSKETALKTVISERGRSDNSESYRVAYES